LRDALLPGQRHQHTPDERATGHQHLQSEQQDLKEAPDSRWVALKGQQREIGFFVYSIMYSMVIKDLKFFPFWPKIRRDRLSFMSIGVFSIYGKIFLAYSPNTFKCF
jgi:hypothetical protein